MIKKINTFLKNKRNLNWPEIGSHLLRNGILPPEPTQMLRADSQKGSDVILCGSLQDSRIGTDQILVSLPG